MNTRSKVQRIGTYILVLLCFSILFSTITVADPDLNINLVDYWSFKQNNYTGDISKTGTNTGTTSTDGKIGDGRYFSAASGQYITMPTNASFNNPMFTLCYWVRYNGTVLSKNTPTIWKGSGTSYWYAWGLLDETKDTHTIQLGGLTPSTIRVNIQDGTFAEASYTWSSWCYVVNNTNITMYKNGTIANSTSESGTLSNDNSGLVFGKYSASYLNGTLDEIAYWNDTKPSLSIAAYYGNTSAGTGYPFPGNYTITLKDAFTNAALTNFSAQVNGINYSTTTGILTTGLQTNDPVIYEMNVSSNQSPYYTLATYNVNASVASTALLVVPLRIPVNTITPLNTTYTYATSPNFTVNMTYANTWNFSFIVNGTSYASNSSYTSNGLWALSPSSPLPANAEYTYWINASQNTNSTRSYDYNILIANVTPSNCTSGTPTRTCSFSAGSIALASITSCS